MRLISAGSLVRAQSGPLNKVKVKRVKVEGTADSSKNNEFRPRLDGHKPRTEDNPVRDSVKLAQAKSTALRSSSLKIIGKVN